MLVYIVLAYAVIVMADPYGLLKQGQKRDFYACAVLCLFSFVLAISLAMDWNIPSPSPFIVNLVKRLY